MGTIFEELVRRFNEENNEEAGEHWTPRDAVRLMAKLIFLPIADQIESGTYLLYDGACGTGGMLTVAEETLQQLAAEHGKQVATHLYGQEINAETYAIAKADLLLKGEGEAADNIVGGPEYSTLSNDAFPSREFDFMLSNPPYGKSWKSDLERMGGKDSMRDPRFVIEHDGRSRVLAGHALERRPDALPGEPAEQDEDRDTPLGSRIAEVHNGISLFTGDAGQGESNIRRWIIENDWLEAIVALPLNMFYNTGIATYVWVLTQPQAGPPPRQGPAHRRHAVVQAASQEPGQEELRTLGRRDREDLRHLPGVRGDRAVEDLPERRLRLLEGDRRPPSPPKGRRPGSRLHAEERSRISAIQSERDESAPAVIKRIHKPGKAEADPLHGLFEATICGKRCVVEYEPDSDLRDTEQIPLLEEGGIEAFLRREVLPYSPDAWFDPASTKVGYEVSFTRYFYKPQPLRTLEEIRADILALEKETEGLLAEIIEGLD